MHSAFMSLHGKSVLGREDLVKAVLDHIISEEGVARALASDIGSTAKGAAIRCAALHLPKAQRLIVSYLATASLRPMVIEGESGIGKSAVLAACAKEVQEKIPSMRLFCHFIGSCPGSSELGGLLQRLYSELAPRQPLPETEIELARGIPWLLERAGRDGGVAIFIDGINQLDHSIQSKKKNILDWLPKTLPPGVRFIVSTITHTISHAALFSQEPVPNRLVVERLPPAVSERLTRRFMQRASCTCLHDGHIQQILAKKDSSLPLWLSVACADLVGSAGDGGGSNAPAELDARLREHISSLAAGLLGLVQQWLAHLERKHGRRLIRAAMCTVEYARYGLEESELLVLLIQQGELGIDAGRSEDDEAGAVEGAGSNSAGSNSAGTAEEEESEVARLASELSSLSCLPPPIAAEGALECVRRLEEKVVVLEALLAQRQQEANTGDSSREKDLSGLALRLEERRQELALLHAKERRQEPAILLHAKAEDAQTDATEGAASMPASMPAVEGAAVDVPRVAARQFAPVLRALRTFLRPCGDTSEGRLCFVHTIVSDAVRLKYDGDNEQGRTGGSGLHLCSATKGDNANAMRWHKALACYFEKYCTNPQRKAEELPYHLERQLQLLAYTQLPAAGVVGESTQQPQLSFPLAFAATKCLQRRLLLAVAEWGTFEVLSRRERRPELLQYCLLAGGLEITTTTVVNALGDWQRQHDEQQSLSLKELAEREARVACFVGECGEYEVAIRLLVSAIDRQRQQQEKLHSQHRERGGYGCNSGAIVNESLFASAQELSQLLHVLADTQCIRGVATNHLGAQLYCKSAHYARQAVCLRRAALEQIMTRDRPSGRQQTRRHKSPQECATGGGNGAGNTKAKIAVSHGQGGWTWATTTTTTTTATTPVPAAAAATTAALDLTVGQRAGDTCLSLEARKLQASLADSLRVLGSCLDMYFFCCERCYSEGYGGLESNGYDGPPPQDDIRVEDAKQQCRAALEESVELFAELCHPLEGVSRQELGMMYYYLQTPGVEAQALSHLDAALVSVEAAYGQCDLETARVCFNIALVTQSQSMIEPGHVHSMRSHYTRCFDIRKELLGEEHPSTKRVAIALKRMVVFNLMHGN
jgi:hypothetical protein